MIMSSIYWIALMIMASIKCLILLPGIQTALPIYTAIVLGIAMVNLEWTVVKADQHELMTTRSGSLPGRLDATNHQQRPWMAMVITFLLLPMLLDHAQHFFFPHWCSLNVKTCPWIPWVQSKMSSSRCVSGSRALERRICYNHAISQSNHVFRLKNTQLVLGKAGSRPRWCGSRLEPCQRS